MAQRSENLLTVRSFQNLSVCKRREAHEFIVRTK